MNKSQKNILQDERGQEPTVMKILVGIILVSLGLGIGVTLYQRFGEELQNPDIKIDFPQHPDGEITMSPGENKWITVEVSETFNMEEGENVTLSAETGELEVEWLQNDPTVKIGNSKQMKIIVRNSTPAREDPYPITVRGETEGSNDSKTLYIQVE